MRTPRTLWLLSGRPPVNDATPAVSAVIPVFNEQENLGELNERMVRALEGMGRPWEIVYVDDGSADRSIEMLRGFASMEPRIRVVEFTRNYGQHSAVFAGLAESRGERVITLDADLQNPPEEIPKVVSKMDEGFDVVGTRRRNRRDTFFRRIASRIVNRIARRGMRGGGSGMSDFGCMLRGYRRAVVDQIGRCREISSFIPVLALLYARNAVEIEVDHAERTRGTSKYGLLQLINLQFDLLTGFSFLPLRFMTWFGGAVALGAFALGVLLFVLRIIKGPEWSQFGVFTLFAVLFLMIGMLFVCMGVLGEYVGRIYAEVRERPRYVIRQVHRKGAA